MAIPSHRQYSLVRGWRKQQLPWGLSQLLPSLGKGCAVQGPWQHLSHAWRQCPLLCLQYAGVTTDTGHPSSLQPPRVLCAKPCVPPV